MSQYPRPPPFNPTLNTVAEGELLRPLPRNPNGTKRKPLGPRIKPSGPKPNQPKTITRPDGTVLNLALGVNGLFYSPRPGTGPNRFRSWRSMPPLMPIPEPQLMENSVSSSASSRKNRKNRKNRKTRNNRRRKNRTKRNRR